MGKRRIEKLGQKRLEWLQRVCSEARETYNFSGLGELAVWMIDNASKVQLKSGNDGEERVGCKRKRIV
jgi:hypothetical protein